MAKKNQKAQVAPPRKIARELRATQALELRVQGLTYDEIGKALGQSGVNAWSMVMEKVKALAASQRELTEEVKAIELRRLDIMLRQCWAAMRGRERWVKVKDEATGLLADSKVREAVTPENLVRLQGSVLRIMQHRTTLLGLAAPTQLQQVNLNELTDDQLRRLSAGENPYAVLAKGDDQPPAPATPDDGATGWKM